LISSFIKPAWALLIGFANEIIEIGFEFLFTNFPFMMITSVFVLPKLEEKLYFLLLTFLSMIAFHQMNLYHMILPTVCVDLVIFAGYQLLNFIKKLKKAKASSSRKYQ